MWLGRHRDRRVGILGLVALIAVQGCGSVTPSRDTPVTPSATASPVPSTRPAAKIVIGVHVGAEQVGELPGFHSSDVPLFPALPNGDWWDQVVRRLVYSGVYRLDEAGQAVPDLAAELCKSTDDRLIITCKLRDARFHDGVALTASDVAFTFETLASADCNADQAPAHCVSHLASADAPDAHTVRFHLSEPDATFLTVALPDILIESRDRVTASYARFLAGSRGAKPAVYEAEAKRMGNALDGGQPDCARLIVDGETAVGALGLQPWSRDEFNLNPGNTFADCRYVDGLARTLAEAARSLLLEESGDRFGAIGAAYRILDYHDDLPVGSGPWKVVDIEPGTRMELVAFDAFHRERPATSAMEVRLIRTKADAVNAVRLHSIDWLVQPFASQAPTFLREALAGDESGLTLTRYQADTWFGMLYNVRPGALFSDDRLRQAVELCIDKEAMVETATGGQSKSIQSPVLPSSWAYEKAVPAPAKDINGAMALIERSGWRRDANGFYAKNGVPLAAKVPVREGRLERLKFLRLLQDQVRDCGMDIEPYATKEMDRVLYWPLEVPGTEPLRHWDLAFNGQISTGGPGDPALDDSIFLASDVTTEENWDGNNLMGYVNDDVDRLLRKARATYIPGERAKLYRDYQLILAKTRPMLFAYALQVVEARSDQLTSKDGPLSVSSATWWWQLEKLVKNDPVP
jgi:ABC-type transport system substrate-binding protein